VNAINAAQHARAISSVIFFANLICIEMDIPNNVLIDPRAFSVC